jgi:hypothetical protein
MPNRPRVCSGACVDKAVEALRLVHTPPGNSMEPGAMALTRIQSSLPAAGTLRSERVPTHHVEPRAGRRIDDGQAAIDDKH